VHVHYVRKIKIKKKYLEDNAKIFRNVSKAVAARRLDSSGYAKVQVAGSFVKMVVNVWVP